MAILFNDDLVAFWFMDVSPTSNWLAAISKAPEGQFKVQWRACAITQPGSDPFSKDERNWYEGVVSGSEPDVIGKMSQVARFLTQMGQGPLFERIRGEQSAEAFLKELAQLPFMHARRLEELE